MNNPTDTNQASEELRKSVEQCFIKNNMCDCDGEHNALNIDETEYFDVESVVNDVISLIRTEKLKLLAEVREQAQSMPIHGGTDSCSPSKYVQAVSIDALTKLEAEL